jgi:hypothetical protein
MTTLENLEWLRGADIRGAGRRKTARPWLDSIEGF